MGGDEGSLVDIEADNGVIHGIDTVLEPTSLFSTIVDIAADNDSFTKLVDALTVAGLVEALSGDGPFTVFGKLCVCKLRRVYHADLQHHVSASSTEYSST